MPWDSNNSNCANVQSTGSAIKREHTLLLTHARINFYLNKRKLLVWYYPKQSLLGSLMYMIYQFKHRKASVADMSVNVP